MNNVTEKIKNDRCNQRETSEVVLPELDVTDYN